MQVFCLNINVLLLNVYWEGIQSIDIPIIEGQREWDKFLFGLDACFVSEMIWLISKLEQARNLGEIIECWEESFDWKIRRFSDITC